MTNLFPSSVILSFWDCYINRTVLGIDNDPCQPTKEGSALHCNDGNGQLTAGRPLSAFGLTSPSVPTSTQLRTLCSCLPLLIPSLLVGTRTGTSNFNAPFGHSLHLTPSWHGLGWVSTSLVAGAQPTWARLVASLPAHANVHPVPGSPHPSDEQRSTVSP